jgi:mannose/cellobiose epimerase-like protein (N-acyl-D-glucosamine 2-epimerase family)
VALRLRLARERRGRGVPLAKAPAVLENLLEGMLRFWDESLIDTETGGYRLGHDARGRPTGADSRHLVTQARTAWFFARLARSPYGDDRHLEWAAHGVRFLAGPMWDQRHGGFFWEVGPDGPRDERKHVYGQAFAIFALCELARAARDLTAVAFASEAAELVDRRAHDDVHGGYLESHTADWSPEPESPGLLGRPPGCKTANAHLHLLEALTELALADPAAALPRRRLPELMLIMSRLAVDDAHGTVVDAHQRDWSPWPGDVVSSYGHDVENVSLLMRACRASGIPERLLEPLYASLWDNVLEHGFDSGRGGLYTSGTPGRTAERRDKVWWVQAEGLLSALLMWEQTGEERYRQAFELTLGWIAELQADDTGGDWHAVVDRNGVPSGDKSGPWKGPYHQGRALLECLELLAAD